MPIRAGCTYSLAGTEAQGACCELAFSQIERISLITAGAYSCIFIVGLAQSINNCTLSLNGYEATVALVTMRSICQYLTFYINALQTSIIPACTILKQIPLKTS